MSKRGNSTVYVRDDLGHAWYFSNGKIRCVLSEGFPGNGYHCDSLEDGIRLLNEYGYITGYDDDTNTEEMEYFNGNFKKVSA